MKRFLAVAVATLALVSLGLAQIHCSSGDGNGYECKTSVDCDPGYYCDPIVHECKEEECIPECTNRCCGADPLCGEQCPDDCPSGTHCNQGTCVCEADCQPNCSGKECGPDGCGDVCGTCSAGYDCNANGICECDPVCTGRICGDDGCGGDCPPGCAANETCSNNGTQCIFECTPNCTGKVCGDDGCNGICPPGCGAGQACVNGQCEAIQAHDGAGDACHCDPPDFTNCPTPCPAEDGAANICLHDANGDGFCTFFCSADGADGECQVDFDGGCCMPTSDPSVFVCYSSEYCGGGEQGYKEPCGTGVGNCQEDYLCITGFGPSGTDGYCVWPCDFPAGPCTDGGACAPTTDPELGWCQPPGPNGPGEFCEAPLDSCTNGAMCMSFQGVDGSYCGPKCDCAGSGAECSSPPGVCAWGWQDDLGNWIACFCGYECDTADDCPGGATGWTCNASNGLCIPQ